MSRIGRLPITIPAGVTCTVDQQKVTVVGSRGTLVDTLPTSLHVLVEGDQMTVSARDDRRATSALFGLYRQLLANMVTGVSVGFSKGLEMKGTGYRAQVDGEDLVLSVGYSHPVRITAPQGISFKVEKNVFISVEGIERQVVGEIAAKIRSVRKPEPYKGKGIRYTGEKIRLKPGKTAKAGA